ncbi:MAG: type II secretion system protein GspK [Candidatus Omnitrophota bacterium]|nr:type II secretion system protein GspK [Candidatus Omnitrophota bacterium]
MSRRSGQMLVITLWMIGIVSLAVGAVTTWSTHEMRLSRFPLEALQREAIAQAAVAQAIAVLTRDEAVADHLQEPWATGDEAGQPVLSNILVGSGVFTAELLDEQRKVHLNTSTEEVLRRLIEAVNVPGVNVRQIAEAIIDWRTASNPETGVCAGQNPPCHDGPLASVDELRLVPGMTPELFDALAPYVTVYPLAGAPVNINTAPAIVLDALNCPGGGDDLVAQREAAAPPVLDPSACAGTGTQSTIFTVSVEAIVPPSSLTTRVRAVIDRNGHILAWLPQ